VAWVAPRSSHGGTGSRRALLGRGSRVYEEGCSQCLSVAFTRVAQWRKEDRSGSMEATEQSQCEEEEEKDFSFDFSPRVTKIEAAVTRGGAKQWAPSVCGWQRRRSVGSGKPLAGWMGLGSIGSSGLHH
jgi:hypothetical protein